MSSPADQSAPDAGRDPSVAARMEQLYERHAAVVRSVCSGLLRDRVEAEDAMQQTFLSAHRALLNGSSPRDEAAWLATIARHESLARVKARMREPLSVDIGEHEAAAPDAHAAALGRHEAGELREALAELPPQQREAILLRELRGLSYQEVAATLSVTTSAVESLLFRARRSLQARLQGALAALSPGCWVQSLRELGSGGVAAPVATKVAVVGVGAALFAGGAFGPKMLGLGPAPHQHPVQRVARPTAHHIVHAVQAQGQAQSQAPPVHLWRVSQIAHTQRQESGDSHTSEISDRGRSSDGSERDDSSAVATQHDDGGVRSRDTASSSDDSSETNDSSDDSSGTTTTATTTTGTTTTETTTDTVTTDD